MMDTQTPFTPNSRPQSPSQNFNQTVPLPPIPPPPSSFLSPQLNIPSPSFQLDPDDLAPLLDNTTSNTPRNISLEPLSGSAQLLISSNMGSRTPKSGTPRPRTAGEGDSTSHGSAAQKSPERPLNVTDALSYLDAVKVQFQDKPDVYNHFLDIMKDFKSEVIDTPGVIERVSMLFHGNPYLIQGFNTFLPPGYRIEMSADPRDPNIITVTTPLGTTTQSTSTFEQISRVTRDTATTKSSLPVPPTAGPGFPFQPVTRSMTPSMAPFQVPHMPQSMDTYSPGLQVPSTTTAASFLNNLSNRNAVENKSSGEFNHAIQYLNKIKARYSDDPDTYKQFLEILQTYQKEQRQIQDSQVYVQVQVLFKDAQDLLSEFKDFLPEVSMALSGAVGILPQPTSGPGVPAPWVDAGDKNGKKTQVPPKKRRKVPEKETTPAPAVRTAPSRAKKPKHTHKGADPDSPQFNSYGLPESPPHHPPHLHASMLPPPQMHNLVLQGSQPVANVQSAPDELIFFERAKRTLESKDTYEEFLKLLNMYSKDIINAKTLVNMAQVYLGDGDLLSQFREVVGVDERQDSIEHGPPGSIRTGPPEALSALPAEDGEGPSYRRLPESEVHLACSGRDELCRFVLNDEWVSHPTWASEEAGFIAHKKNSFEEALHKSEEERHEYQVQLEALSRTIAVIEPINFRIEEMTNEERSTFRLKPDFGGMSKCIYHRTLKKVYGRDAGMEVIQALQECPSVAVPVVLARLKQKDEEWRRVQREWNKTWREVDAKNFYKSLDHQGVTFKSNDKKVVTAKHFVGNIESVKAEQADTRAQQGPPSFATASPGHQLDFPFKDISVLQDSLKLVYSFLDHSHAHYTPQERRGVEGWLRSFVPLLCMCPAAEFNAGYTPSDDPRDDETDQQALDSPRNDNGVPSTSGRGPLGSVMAAGDLRKRLLKSSQDNPICSEGTNTFSSSQSRGTTPHPERVLSDTALEDSKSAKLVSPQNSSPDQWIHDASANQAPPISGDGASRRKPFFGNTTFYTVFCLLQLIYSRLLVCKEQGAHQTAKGLNPADCNPIAIELGLDDPNGPSAILAQAMEAVCNRHTRDATDVVYLYMLEAFEKLFDNELDQAMFEEHMRWFFGNKAYHLFTLDKLLSSLIKQVQILLSDNKCQELWVLLQQTRKVDALSNQNMIRYRREAERHVGADEHLYRFDWHRSTKTMYVQLVEADDPSVNGDGTAINRWREYVDSYVLRQPTEWLSQAKREGRVFLRRHLTIDESARGTSSWDSMGIRVSLGTYKMFYESSAEDVYVRPRSREEEKELRERAKVREEERKRSIWLAS
ncbi:hypothetical protein DEU56DRAFT_769236 [Suillus clintonianus]|uniref:uncharacterized protein n=1 Tax=Suillus clintonianus TaxID=1904413 RepID=UPI001B877ACB|nr:uncharacterized protein DEU56DRAFT_769236 [Suillus clintonianus]KAG2154574.1 hypothetical protein DEU56DRAFT_769236 [Suillus clintonianus]